MMLREADLGALACHAALAPDLQRRLGAETAARLEACVTRLQFDEALTLRLRGSR
ncbi:hypothetical protein ACFONG_08070 [Uliginosibacterium paludis]|uniref:Uncharacterized protein n=1 Tax=Uliginosibacterium paludis TaxID=1615952 RepID=A0ABV2CKJ3_9RHOO